MGGHQGDDQAHEDPDQPAAPKGGLHLPLPRQGKGGAEHHPAAVRHGLRNGAVHLPLPGGIAPADIAPLPGAQRLLHLGPRGMAAHLRRVRLAVPQHRAVFSDQGNAQPLPLKAAGGILRQALVGLAPLGQGIPADQGERRIQPLLRLVGIKLPHQRDSKKEGDHQARQDREGRRPEKPFAHRGPPPLLYV